MYNKEVNKKRCSNLKSSPAHETKIVDPHPSPLSKLITWQEVVSGLKRVKSKQWEAHGHSHRSGSTQFWRLLLMEPTHYHGILVQIQGRCC